MKNEKPLNPFAQVILSLIGIGFIGWIHLGIERSNSADRFQKGIAEQNAKELIQEIDAENYRNRPRY